MYRFMFKIIIVYTYLVNIKRTDQVDWLTHIYIYHFVVNNRKVVPTIKKSTLISLLFNLFII